MNMLSWPLNRLGLNRTHVSYRFRGETRSILGLAGLQYREFFSSIVPFYVSIGVSGAKEHIEWIQQNAQSTLDRLTQYYSNPNSIVNTKIDP
jgi:hypothetical protein